MPNLVGTGLNQVPTNSMLGGMAYQDPEHASIKNLDLKNLSQINSEIADTAVDVFVYDTSKDSDGGAWRKRTQHTSWYNETLNTATRGSRREFPAVAVLVLYDSGEALRIYDGDDPDLPMWMDFTNTSGRNYFYGTGRAQSIVMLNGMFVTGAQATNFWPILVDFLRDNCMGLRISGGNMWHGANIAGRNTSVSDSSVYWAEGARRQDLWYINGYIVNQKVNDVAMTVLPNAPIDSTTGLPVPTIAVATDGGVSVVRDNGTVVDITSASGSNYNQSKSITITEENYLWWLGDYFSGSTYLRDSYAVSLDNFPSSDFTWNNTTDNLSAGTFYALTTNGEQGEIKIGPGNTWAWNHQERNALGGPAGLAIHKPNIGSETNSLIAAITSDYNTGWMHGDCKGAFLSDSDDTNITGTSLIANGDFSSSSTAAFTTVAGGTAAVVGGLLKLTDTAGAFCYASAPFTTVVGDQYYVTVDIVNNSNTAPSNYIRCGNSHNGTEFHNTNYGTGYGTKTFYFTATATTTYLTLISGHGAGNPFGHWDNVFVYKLDNDRTVSAKGLRPYGTITKTPVATGADLVGYSGFSASNQLGNASSYNFGSGTSASMCIVSWFKTTSISNYAYILSVYNSTTDKVAGLAINSTTSSSPHPAGTLYVYDNDNTGQTSGTTVVNDGQWHCAVGIINGAKREIYLDGKLEISTTYTSFALDIANVDKLGVGRYTYTDGFPFLGSLALTRVSKSIPSAAQIKKMYEDEKCLFHENAQATLYGSSDAVTALAFDDTTNLLHVGTSAGRSEFQGLRRINNTTDAVTTAISASNGLVAEQ